MITTTFYGEPVGDREHTTMAPPRDKAGFVNQYMAKPVLFSSTARGSTRGSHRRAVEALRQLLWMVESGRATIDVTVTEESDYQPFASRRVDRGTGARRVSRGFSWSITGYSLESPEGV